MEDDSVDHVDVLPDDYSVDTPMSRMSADTGTNQFGTCLLDLRKQWSENRKWEVWRCVWKVHIPD